MPDGFHASFVTKPFLHSLRELERRVDRATMWSLREVAREMAKEAQRNAPVYSGDDARAKPGELRRSIKPSRRLKHIGPHTYSTVVGPRGSRVHLYAPKIEEAAEYMKRAYERVLPRVAAISTKGWNKAMER